MPHQIASLEILDSGWLAAAAFVAVVSLAAGLCIHVAVKSLQSWRRRKGSAGAQPNWFERAGAGAIGAVVTTGVLVTYLVGVGADTQPLDPPAVIAGLPANTYVVGLGDSIAAGQGNPPFDPGTDTNGCHRSTKTAFERQLRFTTRVTVILKACSGATIDDLAGDAPDLPRGRPHDAYEIVGLPPGKDISLATVIISANDFDWSSVLPFCLEPIHTYCPTGDYVAGQTLEAWTVRRIATVRRDLNSLFPFLRHRIAGRILVIGYPQILFGGPAPFLSGAVCEAIYGDLSNQERSWFRGTEVVIDHQINEAAIAAGLEYVDSAAVFAGHEACGRAGAWINDVTLGQLSAIFDGNINALIGSGSFHPNATGQTALARIVSCYLQEYRTPPAPRSGVSVAGSAGDSRLRGCVLAA